MLARRIEHDEGVELRSFGDFHLAPESGHGRDGDDRRSLAAIVLDDGQRARCTQLVDEVYKLFADWVDELHAYALAEMPRPIGQAS